MENLSVLDNIVLFTILGSVVSLVGGLGLLYKENIAVKFSRFIASFAAGSLLGSAFLDILPEAVHMGEEEEINVLAWALIGFLIFFLIDRLIRWFHHHHYHFHVGFEGKTDHKPTVPLILIGDSIHNFIDGVAIAATFMIDINLGIITTIAVAAHEIPQEIGDFGILLHRGIPKMKVLFFNILSSLTALVGALVTYFLGDFTQNLLPVFLAVTGGFFIYIAASDLIPEIHHEDHQRFAYIESLMLLIGVLAIYITTSFLGH